MRALRVSEVPETGFICCSPDILNPFSAGPYDASKEDNNSTDVEDNNSTDVEDSNSTDVEPLLNVTGSLTLTYPCKKDLMASGACLAQPDSSLMMYRCTRTHMQRPPPRHYTRSLFRFQLPAVTAVVLSPKSLDSSHLNTSKVLKLS
jgi:hypothetical protein